MHWCVYILIPKESIMYFSEMFIDMKITHLFIIHNMRAMPSDIFAVQVIFHCCTWKLTSLTWYCHDPNIPISH